MRARSPKFLPGFYNFELKCTPVFPRGEGECISSNFRRVYLTFRKFTGRNGKLEAQEETEEIRRINFGSESALVFYGPSNLGIPKTLRIVYVHILK